MENLNCCSCLAIGLNGPCAIFTVTGIPISETAYCSNTVVLFPQYSETKKYRQESRLSKVESELSVTLQLLVW